MRQRPNDNDSSSTQKMRCTEKAAGLETLTKKLPPYGRDWQESQPKQTMELSQETQIHSGDGAKATAEGHRWKSLKEKERDPIAARPELLPKGDPVAKEILRSERNRGPSENPDWSHRATTSLRETWDPNKSEVYARNKALSYSKREKKKTQKMPAEKRLATAPKHNRSDTRIPPKK